jgi:hypothetical protein
VTISENGSTLLNRAMRKNGLQPLHRFGNGSRCAQSTGSRIMAASSTRNSTSVNGGSPRSTTPLKKNDPPQRIESRPRSDQSRASIVVSLAVMAAQIGRQTALFSCTGLCHPIPE